MLTKRATIALANHNISRFFTSKICVKSSKSSKKLSKFIAHSNTQIANYGKNGNIKQAESIFNTLDHKTIVSYTAMLTAYASNGLIDNARKVFDEIPDRTVPSYNAMITGYMRNGYIGDGCELFERMGERNAVSYGVMIEGFIRAGMVDKAEGLYRVVPVEWRDPVCSNLMINGYLKFGKLEEAVRVFEGMGKRNVVTWSCMVDGYCKRGRVTDARELFDKMPERNVVSWSAMINGYIKMGSFESGIGLLMDMRREGEVDVNSTTFSMLFEACGSFGRYREGIQMHGLLLRMGHEFDSFLGNSLINMYCRFRCLNAARKIFDLMRREDAFALNSLIAGFVQNDDIAAAYRLFETFPEKNVVSWTTMISGFSSSGLMNEATELFKKMPEKDDVAWTALISGYVNNARYEEAFHWFIEMLKNGMRPNPLTISIILTASAGLASLNQGLQIHACVIKMNMGSDSYVQSSLVSVYSKCGSVTEANQVFREIEQPKGVSFNSMITGFAQNGLGEEGLKLFQEMLSNGQEPNKVTFLSILSACAHMGLVEEGWSYFKSMKSLYHIEPDPNHYACMVDLLGRHGLLDEAINLIRSMPFTPHSGVWGALLSACKIHMRVDFAKLAAQHLFKLEPHSAAPYIGLSNLYSAAGERSFEDQVRMIKKSKRIAKIPGYSRI